MKTLDKIYKEKYEQALERAKVINPGTADYEVAVKIFPELTENENEKMCEALIQYIKEPSVLLDWRRKEFITWLEKQSRNTSDKIVEKARTKKQRVLLTETDGYANIDWDTRSLEDARKLLECGLQYINTELKESEDERIKNEIIAFVEQSIHRGGGTPIPQEQENRWLAWLEKQGKQKSAKWSDYDECMLTNLIEDTRFGIDIEYIDWLKSLKQRMEGE